MSGASRYDGRVPEPPYPVSDDVAEQCDREIVNDLLAALKAMAGYWHSSNDDPEETRIYALAQAAIAKAEAAQ